MSAPDDGDTIYVWQVLDGRDGAWGIISMMNPALGISSPLCARSLEHVQEYRDEALWHQRNTGWPIRLAKFKLDGAVEVIVP